MVFSGLFCKIKAKWIFVILHLSFITAEAQNKYGLEATTFDAYVVSIKSNTYKQLVDLEKYIHGIVLDIRYSTTNNFTDEKIYSLSKAYARKPVAESLKKIQTDLNAQGLSTKIF